MSIAAAWLLANAQLVSDVSGSKLWSLTKINTPIELNVHLGCDHFNVYETSVWCVTSHALFLVSLVGQRQYIREFYKQANMAVQPEEHQWFGRMLSKQYIDNYSIASYSSGYQADALVRGYRLHNSARIEFYREIEHGRYHVVTHSPAADIFVVQQGSTTYTFSLQTKRPEFD